MTDARSEQNGTGRRPRRRPYGWLRHYAGTLTPNAATGIRLAFERDGQVRVRRALASAADRARESRRRSRPTMRALVAAPGGRLRWHQVPAPPPPGPHGATVHPVAIATCDIDCALALGRTPLLLPLQIGHECVAEVTAVGEQVSTVKVGDRVVVPFQISCGECSACRIGHTGSCTAVVPLSSYGMGFTTGHWGGAYADEMTVPYADAMLVKLPPGVDPIAAASLADNICDAYRHIGPHLPSLLARDADAQVLILGAVTPRFRYGSSVPLYVSLIAKACGARNVLLAEDRAYVRAHAQRLGIDAVHPRELRGGPLAPLVIDASFHPRGMRRALAHTAPDGVCTSSGCLHHRVGIPALSMYIRNATLHIGRTHVRPLIADALELIVSERLRPQDVVVTRGPLDEAPRILGESFRSGEGKAVLSA